MAKDNTIEDKRPVPKRERRKRASGLGLKLAAPTREGYRRRFFNDDGNRLAEAQELGYSFVEEQGIDTHGPGSRVNRLAGTKDDGAPLKTYLMETPDELWQQGVDEKEEERSKVDETLNRGGDPSGETGTGKNFYIPEEVRHSSIKVERG